MDFGKNLPAQDVWLIGPTVELIARTDLNPALSDLLLGTAREVHGTDRRRDEAACAAGGRRRGAAAGEAAMVRAFAAIRPAHPDHARRRQRAANRNGCPFDRLGRIELQQGCDRDDREVALAAAKEAFGGTEILHGVDIHAPRGGVFALCPPNLLFIPDRDGDDRPDGPPEVLLSGFGLEDAHAVANSLQWGPDGWLYGAQGSTVTAHIRGIEFQQGIWRFHPKTKKFELFSEGGGNTYGLDFDRNGQVIAGTGGPLG